MTLDQAHAQMVAALSAAAPTGDFGIDPHPADYESAARHVADVGRIVADYLARIMAMAEVNFPGNSKSREEDVDQMREVIGELAGALMRDAERIDDMMPGSKPMRPNYSSKSWNQP